MNFEITRIYICICKHTHIVYLYKHLLKAINMAFFFKMNCSKQGQGRRVVRSWLQGPGLCINEKGKLSNRAIKGECLKLEKRVGPEPETAMVGFLSDNPWGDLQAGFYSLEMSSVPLRSTFPSESGSVGIKRGTGPGECHHTSKDALGAWHSAQMAAGSGRYTSQVGGWTQQMCAFLSFLTNLIIYWLTDAWLPQTGWQLDWVSPTQGPFYTHFFSRQSPETEHLSLVFNNVLKSVGCQWHECVKRRVLIDTALGEGGSLEAVPSDPNAIAMTAGARSCNRAADKAKSVNLKLGGTGLL